MNRSKTRGSTSAYVSLVGGSLGVAIAATVVGRLLARVKEGSTSGSRQVDGHKLQTTVDALGNSQLGLTAGILA